MRNLLLIITLVLIVLSAADAKPKQQSKGSWDTVENLIAGTPISVRARAPFHLMCYFERATDDQLFCQPLHPRLSTRTDYIFERREIREVRLEHSEATNEMLGAATVGGVMAAIGAAGNGSNVTRGGAALLGGAIGALFGGIFGRDFPLFHRGVIYRR